MPPPPPPTGRPSPPPRCCANAINRPLLRVLGSHPCARWGSSHRSSLHKNVAQQMQHQRLSLLRPSNYFHGTLRSCRTRPNNVAHIILSAIAFSSRFLPDCATPIYLCKRAAPFETSKLERLLTPVPSTSPPFTPRSPSASPLSATTLKSVPHSAPRPRFYSAAHLGPFFAIPLPILPPAWFVSPPLVSLVPTGSIASINHGPT